jgi:hypothetical protein
VVARRSGYKVSLRRANSSAVGKMIPTGAKAKKQVNIRKCPKCGAKPGETCFVLTADKFIELNETHTPQTAQQNKAKATRASHQPTTPPAQRRSTPVLDARYQAKKAHEAASKKKLNGG